MIKDDIQVINNFFNPILIYKLKDLIRNNLSEPLWKTNLFWEKSIIQSSSLVSVLELKNNFKDIFNEVKNIYIEKFPEIKNMEFGIHLYLWHKLSYIPFHNDEAAYVASTVYLNNNWNRDWGGFFIYEKENKYEIVKPEFNKCIINKKTVHGTTLTTIDAPPRETLQIFVVNKN
jgi:Rps23 Pro-64 3,4-dihydroxylase Tpa1-like proline 4-hydroxylase